MNAEATDDHGGLEDLRREVRQLREELASLRQTNEDDRTGAPVSRRALFGLAGAGVAGAVVAATASPAAAANGDPLLAGQTTTATVSTTLQTTAVDHGFAVTSDAKNPNAAVSATCTSTGDGLVASSAEGRGIVAAGAIAPLRLMPGATSGPPTGGSAGDLYVDSSGKLHHCVGAGTWQFVSGPGDGALQLSSDNPASAPTRLSASLPTSDNLAVLGVTQQSDAVAHAIRAESQAGSGVRALSTDGAAVRATSAQSYGLLAASTFGVGAFLQGGHAPLRLGQSAGTGAPATGDRDKGEIVLDATGDLYLCVASGAPGTWRRLGGLGTTAYTPLTVARRVYDSRWSGEAGALATGQSRTVSVADGREVSSGAVAVADVVPAGAIAVTYNVTVVNTVARGFLAVNQGGNSVVTVASINWSGAGQVLGNAGNVAVDSSRQITVVCGGASSAADFTIDVTGYFV